MKDNAFRGNLTTGVSIGALMIATPLFAQTVPAAPTPPTAAEAAPPSTAGPTLSEVLVTARRRTESLQKVPIAISVITQDTLREYEITDAEGLSHVIPGLTVSNNNATRDSLVFFIRGQGQTLSGAAAGVVTYFDQVPTDAAGPGLLFDLQNIQVLKGPQGTLFGRNTTGGAILFEPQRPTNTYGGYLDVSLGDYDLYRAQGAINFPIIDDTLLARFAFDLNHRNGFTYDTTNAKSLDDVNYGSFRFSLIYRPNGRFENYLSAFYETSSTNGESLVLDAVKPGGLAELVVPSIVNELAAQQALGVRQVVNTQQPEYDRYTSIGVTDIATYKLSDDITLKSILGYRAFREAVAVDDGGGPAVVFAYPADVSDAFGGGGHPSEDQLSGEFQVQGVSFDNQFTWIAGAYLETQQPWPNSLQNRVVFEVFSPSPTYSFGLNSENSEAVFAEGTIDARHLLPGLKFTAGVRYTWDQAESVTDTAAGAAPTSFAGFVKRTDAFSAPTYNLNLSYNVNDDVMVYIANRRGYKTGGFNSPGVIDNTFLPEYYTDYELGAKTQFAFGSARLRMNLAAFYGDYKSVQVNQYVTTPPPDVTLLAEITNAGSAAVYGWEGDWDLVVGPLEVLPFYSYTFSRFNNYISPDPTGGFSNFAGEPLALTPKNKVGVTVNYTIELGNAGNLRPSVNYTYQSQMQFRTNEQNDPNNTTPGYGLVNLRADWNQFLGHPLTLSVFVTNVTNEIYKVYRVGPYNELGYSGSVYGAPRMWGGEIRYEF